MIIVSQKHTTKKLNFKDALLQPCWPKRLFRAANKTEYNLVAMCLLGAMSEL